MYPAPANKPPRHFRLVARARHESQGAPPIPPAEVIRGVWEGRLSADDYVIAIEVIEERDDPSSWPPSSR